MKQIYKIFFLALLLSVSAKPVQSQKSNPIPDQTQARITTEFIESRMYEATKGINSNREIEGSPYFNENWEPGYFIKTNGKGTKKYPMRLNIYKNQLEFKFDENTIYVASPKPIKGFVLNAYNGSDLLFMKGFDIPNSDVSQKTFLEVLHDGKTKLLVHHSCKFNEGHSKDMFTGKFTDRYVSTSNYYLMNATGQFEQVKLREKDILKTLESRGDELKAFIDQKDLNLKKEEDVITFLVEYDRRLSITSD